MERMRTIDTIIIHCTATYPDMNIGASEIDQWHRDRGFDMIGYHYVIKRNGEIESGRDESVAGAHARGYNSDSIGVALVGGLAKDGNQPCNFTAAQWASLDTLVKDLCDRHDIKEVIGHNDVSEKTCPTFDVKAWWGV